ncbi:MAG: hypothetical protein CL887_00085 [Dehalococcoidia bacterium]|nr:hypothetical protein [Dehalococcoidia bacterium]|tara:strand:+ start:1607 stop:2062 length:456 start_codon:yes stop_codon:yes gene_type:complete
MSSEDQNQKIKGSGNLSNRVKILVAFVVLVGALGYFSFLAFKGATVYYYTVSEIIMEPATIEGKMVRVSGKLVPESFTRAEDSTVAHFMLTDGVNIMPAVHNGVLPDLFFNEHSEIILEGSHAPEHAFDSQNVIVKCPSKYVALVEDGKDS